MSDLTQFDLPEINPGEPVANPAIGATGDDNAEPQPFDVMQSPESVTAFTAATAQVAAIAAGVAAAAAAAAAAGVASSASGVSATGASSSSGASSTGGSNSSQNSQSSAQSTDKESSEESGELGSLDYAQDEIALSESGWGDKLAWFAMAWLTFFDARSRRIAERTAPWSPLFAKVINDGAYLRSMLGSLSFAGWLTGLWLGVTAALENSATFGLPTWQLLLPIALLGVLDAASGFIAATAYSLITLALHGIPTLDELNVYLATYLVAVGPAMIATALRGIRKEHARNSSDWWERLTDSAVIPFMSGWTAYTIITVTPAVTGLTNNSVNHVNDFALGVALFGLVRVVGEELAARWFPQRLDRINPDAFEEPNLIQRVLSLGVRYVMWLVVSAAVFGFGWQIFVGSALFLVPTVLGWFADPFPNYPWLWKLMPIGVPGLAFAMVLSGATAALLASLFGAVPALAEWSYVLTPLPLLVYSLLGLFARHGESEISQKPIKGLKWVYRIGGIAMFLLTLKLAGLF